MAGLLDQLNRYGKTEFYPFHMPGHKRNMPEEIDLLREAAGMDITEIEGFDNLHCPEGILKEAQERAARVFGAEETFFLVNGSTAGILTAVSAAVNEGGRIIAARNCHKSVYHAIFLRKLNPVFLFPDRVPVYGIADAVTPEQVEKALTEYPDAGAVLITSPTYDGVVSDVKAIGDIAHRFGVPLIVDAAHGAHFGFASGWPESPVRLGADLVIQSLHKTLPSLTQTALLHVNGSLVDLEKVRMYEGIYQTSSPSYLLMGSMDACVRLMEEQGRRIMEEFSKRLDRFEEKTSCLQTLRLMNRDLPEKGRMKAFDRGKLLIWTGNGKLTGNFLYKELLNRYYLQMEMACDTYVTAIATPWDTDRGLERLAQALLETDRRAGKREEDGESREEQKADYENGTGFWPEPERARPLHEAQLSERHSCPLEKAAGGISGVYVNLYPPGIPLVIPGEILTEEVINLIEKYVSQGLNVQGVVRTGNSGACTVDYTIAILN